MEFTRLLLLRQSTRKYLPRPVEPEKLRLLAEAVRLSPSASNVQPWRLILVDEPGRRAGVARATLGPGGSFNTFVDEAPVLFVLALEKPPLLNRVAQAVTDRDFTLMDAGIAAAHLCLQAAELGLGTCMLGWFDEKRIKGLLGIPAGVRIALVITVGYSPDDYPLRPKNRKPIREIVRSFTDSPELREWFPQDGPGGRATGGR
jgi:nitroreductase